MILLAPEEMGPQLEALPAWYADDQQMALYEEHGVKGPAGEDLRYNPTSCAPLRHGSTPRLRPEWAATAARVTGPSMPRPGSVGGHDRRHRTI